MPNDLEMLQWEASCFRALADNVTDSVAALLVADVLDDFERELRRRRQPIQRWRADRERKG